MTLSKDPYKGTRDYFPEDKALQNYIFNKWREIAQSFGFQEYGSPLLEPLDLYLEKSGTELASDQAYSFKDKGGREVSIRPEATPSVSRMVSIRRQELPYPARLFSIANYMRYERPQKGREREFWQLNIDTFGAEGVSSDAETIMLAEKLLTGLGATKNDFTILISNRKLLNDALKNFVGLAENQIKPISKLIDNKNKISEENFRQGVKEIIPFKESQEKLFELINTNSLQELKNLIGETKTISQTEELLNILTELGVQTAKFDISLVRGLDYYTGMVFEVIDNNPENNRSIFGGGRYDGLVEMFGVEPISAVGFAPGYTTTELFLKTHNLLPKISSAVDVYVATIDDQFIASHKLAEFLRAKNYKVDVDASSKKLDKKIKLANKKQAKYLVVVGNKEAETSEFSLKNLATGEQEDIASFK